ncbi:MAG: hypothetical protein RMK51_12235, partial [Meiothermus sp.]|uniref:hypothetical protein n=1 Tax=Meiothermus sp. TaxID=1955249 RepID=UPI00298F350E
MLPFPASLTAPSAGQSGLPPNAALSWSRPAESVCLFALASAGQPIRVYYTAGVVLNPGLEANRTYTWGVACYGP